MYSESYEVLKICFLRTDPCLCEYLWTVPPDLYISMEIFISLISTRIYNMLPSIPSAAARSTVKAWQNLPLKFSEVHAVAQGMYAVI